MSDENIESNTDQKLKMPKFTMRELGGAFGDWGTLIPFIIGYVSLVGLYPAGIFLTLGITNIILGIRFNLPLPTQPQKTIGTIAISNPSVWTANMVISTGFGTGIIWTILGFTKVLGKIVKKVPKITVRAIQLGLALILGWAGIKLFVDNILLSLLIGVISAGIILLLINSKKIPSAVVLVIFGIVILFLKGTLTLTDFKFSLPYLEFQIPNWENLLRGMLIAGIGQLLLTLTNVMIATITLIKDLFPEKAEEINANTLAQNMGIMNLINPFFGGMPLCHGSGGLAAQYAFGARTGGSMILEGILELILGLFFSETLFLIFSDFPGAILGTMLIYTAFLLGKISTRDSNKKTLPIIIISAIFCLFLNITVGFIVALALYFLFRKRLDD